MFALLGPNGAGKSTTVKILSTLSRPDSGPATVAGIDVGREPDRVRRAIGLVGQKAIQRPDGHRAREPRARRPHPGHAARGREARANELLERFALTEAADRLARTYSGGMARKLDVAIGLMHRPAVLFLDEPTTGLDPEARAEMWAEIERLSAAEQVTVLLTTHYLEEADRLADRLAIVDHGRVVVEGAPDAAQARAARRHRAGRARLDDDAAAVARLLLAGLRGLARRRQPRAAPLRARAGSGARRGPGRARGARGRRRAGRLGHRRAAVAGRRLPALRRAQLRGGGGMTAIARTPRYLTARSLRTLWRQPAFAAMTLIQPIIWLLLFGALFESVVEIPASPQAGSYLEFITPGVIVMTALFSSGWAGTVYIEDMNRGVMDRLLASPVRRGAMMVGTLAYQAVTTIVQTFTVLAIALIAGARFDGGRPACSSRSRRRC